MTLRLSKTLLVAAVALFYALVVFNNLTDYDSNYEFVHHVLLMDSTFPGNHGLWRAIHPAVWHFVFYDSIILWEACTLILCAAGAITLARALRRPAHEFLRARRIAVAGLTVGSLMWFVAFLSIGGEWFLMWQSKIWNGQEAAFRMFLVNGLILLLLAMPETDPDPTAPR
jgi:predicted small integral membrane protein